MSARPLYWASLFFVFGLVAASIFIAGERLTSFVALIALPAIALAVARARGRKAAIVCCLIWLVGVGYYTLYDRMNETRLGPLPEPLLVEGRLVSTAKVDGDRARFVFRLRKIGDRFVDEKVDAELLLRTKEEYELVRSLRYGSSLALIASLSAPQPPRNPGAIDYRRYLYYQRIHWTLTGHFPEEPRIEPPSPFHPLYRLDDLRKKLARALDDTLEPIPAAVAKGLVLGTRDDIPSEIADHYAKLGLAHLLAISGLHMTVLVGGLLLFGEFIGLTREKKLLGAMLFIPFYILLVGASPSVARSGIMAIVVLLARYVGRSRDGLNAWGFACLFLLIFDPYQIWNVAFQLSFVVTWGLLVLTDPLAQLLPIKNDFVRSAWAVTLSAELAATPIILYYFHQYNFLSPLLNFLFVPLYSAIIIPLSFICLCLGAIHPSLSYLLGKLLSNLLNGANVAMEWVVGFKSYLVYAPSPANWQIAAYYFALSLLPFAWRREKNVRFYLFGALAIVCLPLFSFQEEKVVITFLDVGQGDAIVVETPPHRAYVIDAGGALSFEYAEEEAWRQRKERYDPGRKVVVPFLKSRGINRIDAIFMTHGDADHIGGLFSVLKEFKVDLVVGNGKEPSTDLERQLIDYIEELDVPLKRGKLGDHWQDGEGVRWSIWHPREEGMDGASDNDWSMVLLLEAYGKRILFAGDLEAEGERRLLALPLPTPIDVLKVAHHGSQTSTQEEWVDALRPKVAVISAGRNNRYGHPSPKTIAHLEKHGAQIFRTDESGAITLEISEHGWKVTTSSQL